MRREFHVRFCEGPGVQFPRATRLVIAFERMDDAEKVMREIHERMQRHGLSLHPEKTRLVPFARPWGRGGKGTATFDFLGFTVSWRRTRTGSWRPGFETRRKSVRRVIESVTEYCRRQRHQPVKTQHTALCRKVRGHFNYFGVNGNVEALQRVVRLVERIWGKWLRRRSQRRKSWEWFTRLLRRLPLPAPGVYAQIWG